MTKTELQEWRDTLAALQESRDDHLKIARELEKQQKPHWEKARYLKDDIKEAKHRIWELENQEEVLIRQTIVKTLQDIIEPYKGRCCLCISYNEALKNLSPNNYLMMGSDRDQEVKAKLEKELREAVTTLAKKYQREVAIYTTIGSRFPHAGMYISQGKAKHKVRIYQSFP